MTAVKFSPYFQAILDIQDKSGSFCALSEFSIEHLFSWIDRLIHIYQEPGPENKSNLAQITKFSKNYYTKKVN